MQRVSAIGLMSGTSLDGIDVALINTDGREIGRFGPTFYRPYGEEERALLGQALADAGFLTDRKARPGALAAAEALVTQAHGEAVEAFLAASGIQSTDVAVIGFHGQTVLHRPQQRLTVQIGDGAALAQRLGIPIVYDFRAADVAAGGQGAPLVPVFHQALAAGLDRPRPLAVLNIGGVANITVVTDNGDPIAFDIGPGNALLDDFMGARAGVPLDHQGAAAALGKIDEAFVARALSHPFFAQPFPKSLDRNAFASMVGGLDRHSVPDGAATLTALTVEAVARAVAQLPAAPSTWVVAGGGAHNPTLMRMLTSRLVPALVETADAVGWSTDALEAQAFAYLAVRRLYELPITFPTTTGVGAPMTGGLVLRP